MFSAHVETQHETQRRSLVRALPAPQPAPRSKHIAIIGNFPPRRCGIATFTADLHDALTSANGQTVCDIYAMTEAGASYGYTDAVVMGIRENDPESYMDAARRINATGAEAVSLQHEFGIFGGAAGEYILPLLAALRAPVITTLHTILERPDAEQRRVLTAIIALSRRVIVMADKGRAILQHVYDAPAAKIVVTPHGAPDMPLEPTEGYKRAFGWTDRRVLLTFGLLSPNKGIEHVIDALPEIVVENPDVLYVVLGATHPHLKAREGETYREKLQAQAKSLGVEAHVAFIDAFVGDAELLDVLRAADIYVTPYLHEAQITSGTLACAVALGRAIVSTPYWHAKEVLSDGRGVLCPFADTQALATAIGKLLQDEPARALIAERAYALGRQTTWANVARRYLATFDDARKSGHQAPMHNRRPLSHRLPDVNFAGLEDLTDDRGVAQHTVFCVPDRSHGYCLDDAARALILVNDAHNGGFAPGGARLAKRYAAFVQHAWNRDVGAFRNFMAFNGAWLEECGSQDSFGRALWSLGSTALRGPSPALRQWASNLAADVLPFTHTLGGPRSRALAILGLVTLHAAGQHRSLDVLEHFAQDLLARAEEHCNEKRRWFEETLSYDNARLPEALLRASSALGDTQMARRGLDALKWLCSIQTAQGGWFRPIGSNGMGGRRIELFDQQPLEAAATIDACRAAFELTGDECWRVEARRAYDWYLGANDLNLDIAYPEEGVCHDGLTPVGVNRNQGAESVIAFQAATCAMHALARSRAAQHLSPRAS